MTDENDEHVRRLIRQEMEAFINSHNWPDDAMISVLMEVAKDHVWKKGAYERVKYWVNIVGFLGVIGGAIAMIVSVLGFEVVQK